MGVPALAGITPYEKFSTEGAGIVIFSDDPPTLGASIIGDMLFTKYLS